MPICVVCDRSREHRGHSVLPLEEAVEGFKVRARRAGRNGRGREADKGTREPDASSFPPRKWLSGSCGSQPSFPLCPLQSLRTQTGEENL